MTHPIPLDTLLENYIPNILINCWFIFQISRLQILKVRKNYYVRVFILVKTLEHLFPLSDFRYKLVHINNLFKKSILDFEVFLQK